MATINGQDYTGFKAVNLKSSGGIRFGGFDANAGTLYFAPASLESTRSWNLPDKSGTFGISGTFSVDLPIIASSGYLQTVVTVTGIRAEDGIILNSQNQFGGAALLSARGAAIIAEAFPGNGSITITFVNAFATATIARTNVYGYTAVR